MLKNQPIIFKLQIYGHRGTYEASLLKISHKRLFLHLFFNNCSVKQETKPET